MSVALENMQRAREIAARQCPEVAARIYGRRQQALSPAPKPVPKPRPTGPEPADMNDPDVLATAVLMWREGVVARVIEGRFNWTYVQFEHLRRAKRSLFPPKEGLRWTDERLALLGAQYPQGRNRRLILADLNALPGLEITDDQMRAYATKMLGLRRAR